jgi:hypothetical protein
MDGLAATIPPKPAPRLDTRGATGMRVALSALPIERAKTLGRDWFDNEVECPGTHRLDHHLDSAMAGLDNHRNPRTLLR